MTQNIANEASPETDKRLSNMENCKDARKRVKERAKGLARAYKRMDSKRALSSSKLQVSLSPIKETKPKLTSSLSNRSILSISELVDFDEGSLHDSILADSDFSDEEVSEVSFSSSINTADLLTASLSADLLNGSLSEDLDQGLPVNTQGPEGFKDSDGKEGSNAPKMPKRGDSLRYIGNDSSSSIPPELLLEDPSLATNGRWESTKRTTSGRWSSEHSKESVLVMPTRLDSTSCLQRQDSWASFGSQLSSSGDSVDTFVLCKATRLRS